MKFDYLSKMSKDKLKDINNISLTSDIWTDIQIKSCIGLTIHYLEGTKFKSGNILYE